MRQSIDPMMQAVFDIFKAVKNDPTCSQVEMRYNSPAEFDLCVTLARWLMKKFEDRGLKVSITP